MDDVWNMTFSGVDHEIMFHIGTNMTEMGTTLPTVKFVGSNVTKGDVTLIVGGNIPAEEAAIFDSDKFKTSFLNQTFAAVADHILGDQEYYDYANDMIEYYLGEMYLTDKIIYRPDFANGLEVKDQSLQLFWGGNISFANESVQSVSFPEILLVFHDSSRDEVLMNQTTSGEEMTVPEISNVTENGNIAVAKLNNTSSGEIQESAGS